MTRPKPLRLADPKAEEVRRTHHDALVELQAAPFASAAIIPALTLPDNVTMMVAHGLGQVPSFVFASIPRAAVSAGFLVEKRDATVDRKKYVAITAHGYGAPIVIDLAVLP